MTDAFEVRPITVDERERAIDVCNAAFGFGVEGKPHFGRDLPYVWNDDRIGDTWVCFDGGKMVGVVGAYPLEVTLAGVSFRSCCVGQVATLPDDRGRGVMSAILRRVTAVMDTAYDFTWLGGPRKRYGRYGWAFGGVKHCFRTNANCLPDPPDPSTVRPMEPDRDGEMIWRYTQAMPYGIGFDRRQFDQLLSIRDVGGVVGDDAWVVFRGSPERAWILLADGPTESIALLLAHLGRQGTDEQNPEGIVGFEAGPHESPLSRVALKHYSTMEMQQVGGFRLCDMAGYFRRACRIVEPTLAGGSDELSLRNTDTGQAVRIVCSDGKLSVDNQPGRGVRELTTTQLSEAVFSLLSLDVVLPGLAANSPLRPLLRMPVYLPFSLYAM